MASTATYRIAKDGQEDRKLGHLQACDNCRKLKVKCDKDKDSASKDCARCARLDKVCTTTIHTVKKRRKRTDARVGELERRIETLIAVLNGNGGAVPVATSDARPDIQSATSAYQTPTSTTSPSERRDDSAKSDRELDVIDRGLLSVARANELFDLFMQKMLPQYPLIAFRENTTFSDVRQSTPVLFLTMLGAACGTSDPDLGALLSKEILRIFADKVMLDGVKSIEMIKACVVFSVWYFVPDDFAEVRFTQFISMAATMALHLNLARMTPRPGPELTQLPASPTISLTGWTISRAEDAWSRADRYRTMLSCQMLSSIITLILRQPAIIPYTEKMTDCITELVASVDGNLSEGDRSLIAWVKIQGIFEKAAVAFGRHDDDKAKTNLADTEVASILTTFQKQLRNWEEETPSDILNGMNSAIAIASLLTRH